MKRTMLALVVAATTVGCTTFRVMPPPPSAEVSGRWTGVWRTVDLMNVPREGRLDVDLAQEGARGRGRMVWVDTYATDVPQTVRLAGALGVPVVFVVAGNSVLVRHERSARDLSLTMTAEGDEMKGAVDAASPIEIRLVREWKPDGPTTIERLGRVETDLVRERERVGTLASRVAGLGTAVDGARGTAGQAASTAERALAAAGESSSKAGQAVARVDEIERQAGTNGEREHAPRALVHTLDVRFAFDRANLDARAATALGEVAEMLKENPEITAELEGYADAVGTSEYNLRLSQRRVENVHRHLARLGVPLERLHVVGLGQLPDTDADARSRNRRVTVKLLIAEGP